MSNLSLMGEERNQDNGIAATDKKVEQLKKRATLSEQIRINHEMYKK
jgi:hypothetical protein